MKNKFLLYFLIFMVSLSVVQNLGDKGESATTLTENDLGIMTDKTDYTFGKELFLTLQNNTNETITFSVDCPDEPFDVSRYSNGEWIAVSAEDTIKCEEPSDLMIAAGEKTKISYKDWAYRLFSDYGRYKISTTATINGEAKTFSSNEFTIGARGLLGTVWLDGIYRPILNTLVYLIKVVPNNNLGLAIIALTLLIRTVLLIPSQRALRAQKKMQEIQPKLEALKTKHKDNQELLAMETMKIWKENKVNPLGSCAPLLIQFPILIALYYVVREGLHIDKQELLYDFVASDFSFDLMQTNFLGILELTEINFFILPLIVGGLQFIQMNLAMARAKKKKEAKKTTGKALDKKVKGTKDAQNEMQMATSMMKYVMPFMIAFFTASLPAGVGLYWGTSTIYGIAQQVVVNREGPQKANKSEPSVRVVEK
jgi:YidC/Oxa1 family membrane protein insertase